MARDHARIVVEIWNDPDFRALSRAGQHMYLMLATHDKLSYCGVMDWWPNRLATLCSDLTESLVYEAVAELQDTAFVHLDVDTSELLVRSYVRYDGVMKRANMAKAMVKAVKRCTSLDVRERVYRELARLRVKEPTLQGWIGLKDEDITVYETVISMALAMATE